MNFIERLRAALSHMTREDQRKAGKAAPETAAFLTTLLQRFTPQPPALRARLKSWVVTGLIYVAVALPFGALIQLKTMSLELGCRRQSGSRRR